MDLADVPHRGDSEEVMSVQCAENGKKALSELKRHAYDLLITDYDMPELDGLSLTRQASVMAPDMPVVLTTGNIHLKFAYRQRESG